MNHLVACCISLVVPMSAHATQTIEEAKRLEMEYRFTQEPIRRGGDNSFPGANTALALDSYENVALGDGIDGVAGEVKSLCWNPATLHVRTRKLLQQYSSFRLVKSTKELKSYLTEEATLSGDGTFGAFSAKGSTNRKIVNETTFSSNSTAIIAKYTYIHGLKWLDGPPPTLMPYYSDLLVRGQYGEFQEQCGNQYISQAQIGATLIVVYQLTQQTESNASEGELRAAFEAKYGGYGSINGTGSIDERQSQILSSYSVSSQCYANGGNPNVCRFITEQGDIGAAWQALVAALQTDDNLAALSEMHQGYDVPTRNPLLGEYRTRMAYVAEWESIADDVGRICSALPYIDECASAKRTVEHFITSCSRRDEPCEPPTTSVVQEVYGNADVGSVSFFQHKDYRGTRLSYALSISGRYGTIKPGILYVLDTQHFDKILSSVTLDPRVEAHFRVIFYERLDGKGKPYLTGSTPFVGKSFNDKARSFRIVVR